MQITDELLDKICKLAKLEVPAEKREAMKSDFQKLCDFVDRLQEVDTDEVEPLIHMTEDVNRLREDVAVPPMDREAALQNAPSRNEAFFRVPKVVSK
ncbi:MAG: Asp-tRNA(Asn)/Glu-tRNA(Gln) amidotransferase subunit GatC [Bacteroidota bacterium]